MKKIRVLVVDDSVVIRRLVSEGLAQDPLIEIAGIAANGRIALQRLPQCNPDAVTLDIEMPELDGLETLKLLRVDYPRLPVIMFSTLTERCASFTLEALSLGASDYVTKPSSVGGVSDGIKRIHDDLIPKIKALCGRPVHPVALASALKPAIRKPLAVPADELALGTGGIQIVAIGTSTGGPNALADVLPLLAADFPVPIVITQHMPPLFTKLLAERLNSKSQIRVSEGQEGMVVEKGHAYLAPGDHHMLVRRKGIQVVLTLNQEPPENSCRPAVDPMFRSVVELYGGATLAVILTGMGQDGLRGCEAVRDVGGQILAQDEASSVVWGMPGLVAKADLADRVLPLSMVAKEIMDRVLRPFPRHDTAWLKTENRTKHF